MRGEEEREKVGVRERGKGGEGKGVRE
jgi:hypothetical protein